MKNLLSVEDRRNGEPNGEIYSFCGEKFGAMGKKAGWRVDGNSGLLRREKGPRDRSRWRGR